MKKFIAFAIAAIMVLSLIPAMAFSASAEEEAEYAYPDPLSGPWSIYRGPGSYKIPDEDDEPSTPTPAPGYKYTSEGFQITSADYTNMSPWWTVQTSQPQDLKQGFYVQFRVDEFAYRGEDESADEWIAFTVANSRLVSPGSTNHNDYLCVLLRGTGNGSVAFTETAIGIKKTEDKPGSFGLISGGTSATVPMDEDGKEIYDIEIKWEGDNYVVYVCGVAINNPQITSLINGFEDCYVGMTMMSTVKDSNASMTILKMGTSKADATTPDGTDEADPEENMLTFGDPIDPSTIEQNKPCAIWNVENNNPSAGNMTFSATANNTYHITATASAVFFSWGIKNALTYMAEDFPVFVMMLKDYYGGESGSLYYNAGEILSANTNYLTQWSMFDDNSMFYGADEEYCLVVNDLTGMWEGRINSVRMDFACNGTETEPAEWDIEYMAFFRSVEEAHAYAEEYMKSIGVDPDATAEETQAPTEDPADDEETQAPTTDNGGEGETKDNAGEGETSGTTNAPTTGDDKGDDKADEGCASVIGMSAVILMAAAAAVVLKKKD